MNNRAEPVPAIIVDLDGVVYDHRRRLHLCPPFKDAHLEKNWETFHAEAVNDKPFNDHFSRLLHLLLGAHGGHLGGWVLLYVTSRPERFREQTEAWLRAHSYPRTDYAAFDVALYMRKDDDNASPAEMKKKIYDQILEDGFQPQYALDDSANICRVWRDLGITTFQVAHPTPEV